MSEVVLDDLEECPPLSPMQAQRVPHSGRSDHRFSVRQIQFNLITSLLPTPGRSSFISRASSKMPKNYNSATSSQVTNRRSLCAHKPQCPKGIKALFSCCNMYNASGRSKVENSSVYSNGSAFNKVLNGSSFAQRDYRISSVNHHTEDFSDEVDEYENDQLVHRLSLVKRRNVNSSFINQPGIKIREPTQPLVSSKRLDALVTKMPIVENFHVNLSSTNSLGNTLNIQKAADESFTSSSAVLPQDIHRLHFLQTVQALHTIKNQVSMPHESEIEHLKVDLPPLNGSKPPISNPHRGENPHL